MNDLGAVYILGKGRMGKLVFDLLENSSNYFGKWLEYDEGNDIPKNAIVVDFSGPGLLMNVIPKLYENNCKLISGTTGFSDEQWSELISYGERMPILHATNFSIGIAMMNKLASMLSQWIGSESEIDIMEKHHKHKVDAPSGTALTLAERVSASMDKKTASFGYHYPRKGKRNPEQIQMHAIRSSQIIGEHEISFGLESEIISVKHTALKRSVFAEGAINCIPFIEKKSKGFYDIEDALDLKNSNNG